MERNPLGDYTLPLAALVRGRRARAMLLRLFGDRRIEELEREYFCVSCDLVTSELVVHRRGALCEAVGASICLPGIAPPVSRTATGCWWTAACSTTSRSRRWPAAARARSWRWT